MYYNLVIHLFPLCQQQILYFIRLLFLFNFPVLLVAVPKHNATLFSNLYVITAFIFCFFANEKKNQINFCRATGKVQREFTVIRTLHYRSDLKNPVKCHCS